jgi:hypothetical protein
MYDVTTPLIANRRKKMSHPVSKIEPSGTSHFFISTGIIFQMKEIRTVLYRERVTKRELPEKD